MAELKVYHVAEAYDDIDVRFVYRQEDADAVIAEKDAEIQKWKAALDACERQFQEKVDEIAVLLDKLIEEQSKVARHKYKRCLDKAEMCLARYDEEDARVNGRGASWDYISKEMKYWERWRWRWLKLAEKFKEAKQ